VPDGFLASRQPSSSAPLGAAETLPALAGRALDCHRAERFDEAIALYRSILARAPGLAVIYNNLGHAHAALGRLEPAVASYRRAIELCPDNPQTLCNWGVALADLGRLGEAEAKFRHAIALDPCCAAAYNNLGLILKEAGRLGEAACAAEEAVRLAPRNPSYYDNLAAVRRFVAGDPYLTSLEAMAQDCASFGAAERMHRHFALAKAYDHLGRFDDAFVQLLAANELKRRQIAYDEAATLAGMDRTAELFTSDFMRPREGLGEPAAVPVFIIGMPRSGTTLVEQILASHPEIFGAGELQLFEQAIEAVGDTLPARRPLPEAAAAFSAEHFRAVGVRYLDELVPRAPAAARITDKMPANFLFAGLIHLALPNATIIHVVRDPIDTCVSCFSVHFTRGQAHSYDLAELGRYYRHYRALMAHWHRVLPRGRILDVHYEELVGGLEGVARRMIAHCGLPWDARCLDFHRSERPVRTASATQVRQPVHQGAVGRWRRYERFLAPLLAALGAQSHR